MHIEMYLLGEIHTRMLKNFHEGFSFKATKKPFTNWCCNVEIGVYDLKNKKQIEPKLTDSSVPNYVSLSLRFTLDITGWGSGLRLSLLPDCHHFVPVDSTERGTVCFRSQWAFHHWRPIIRASHPSGEMWLSIKWGMCLLNEVWLCNKIFTSSPLSAHALNS